MRPNARSRCCCTWSRRRTARSIPPPSDVCSNESSTSRAAWNGRPRPAIEGEIMVIVMQKHASDAAIERVVAVLSERGFDVHRSTGSDQTVLGVVGDVASVDPREFEVLEGVQEAVRVSEPYKLSSRSFRRQKTVVTARGIAIGGSDVVVMAGPCTIENERQLFETARKVARAGARVLRGGAYKPRTS